VHFFTKLWFRHNSPRIPNLRSAVASRLALSPEAPHTDSSPRANPTQSGGAKSARFARPAISSQTTGLKCLTLAQNLTIRVRKAPNSLHKSGIKIKLGMIGLRVPRNPGRLPGAGHEASPHDRPVNRGNASVT
jgi:hypothetical protein